MPLLLSMPVDLKLTMLCNSSNCMLCRDSSTEGELGMLTGIKLEMPFLISKK